MSWEEAIWKRAAMRSMRFLTSLLAVLLLLTCSACSIKPSDPSYLEPLDDSPVFPYLKQELQHELLMANKGADVANYVLEMLGKPLPDLSLKDYHGNDYRFPKEGFLVLELVASWCEHCQRQARDHNPELLAAGIELVEYFNIDGPEGIDSFLKITGQSADDLTIIPHDDQLTAYIDENYRPEYYPTFIIINDGKVVFACSSQLSLSQLLSIRKLCQLDLHPSDLVDDYGNSIFSYYHPWHVLEAEIGKERLDLLKQLDNDGNTYYLTLSQIGKKLDLESLSDYAQGKTVIFVLSDDQELAAIEEYQKKHPAIRCLIICRGNVSLAGKTSLPYLNADHQIKDLNLLETAAAFTAVYLLDGRIAGVYSNPTQFASADKLFFGKKALIYLQ